MVQVKASEAIMAVLGTLQGRAEVLDDRGNVVAYLIPAESEEELLRRKAFAAYNAEEWAARKARSEGKPGDTTEQVLEHLRSR